MDSADFFAQYQDRTNKAHREPPEIDVEAMAGAFADCYIAATPAGVWCGDNDQELRDVIPRGMSFQRSVGTQSMTIQSLTVTPLDQFHSMAKVRWVARYLRKDGSQLSLEFDVIYLLQHLDERNPKIFGWVTGDEMALLRANGLLPDQPAE